MSWTAGSDIPDIVTGIGDYAKDIPDILAGLNDGFSDVIEISGNTWEVVVRIPDIIDKQAEAALENVTKGFNDVIEIGGGIAEKVAEMPDIIDFAKDGVLAGLLDLGDTLSLPLSGVLESVNSHTGILESIENGVLSIPNSIATSFDDALSAIKELGLSFIDYTGFLQQIIELLKSILQLLKDFMSWFVIDFDAIKAHLLLALGGLPVLKGYDTLLGIINGFKGQFGNSYDYPKITMQTPDVLLPFLKKPEIVIIDFKEYAELFIWVRTIMGFAIIFGFVVYVIKEIKVEFTLN